MQKGIFITGTGTDIGKTYVSALLVKYLRGLGVNCGYYKPVLSGALNVDGKHVPGDVQYVLDTCGICGDPLQFVSYSFVDPVSPHLASKLKGVKIDIAKIIEDYSRISITNDFTGVEGAGGVVCPLDLDKKIFIYDISKLLGLDVLVVADSALGTINNTFLTVDFLRKMGIKVKGIILNNFDGSDFLHVDNRKTLEEICEVKVVSTVAKNGKSIDFEDDFLKVLYE